jgi:D-hexose-6-phosphate mutarotase
MPDISIEELDKQFGRAGRIAFERSPLGGPVAVLAAPGGRAVVSVKGAQVLSWQPAGASEVLWLSPVARLDSGKAVRGGAPVCWPWFGAHPDDAKKPAHGFARTADFQGASVEIDSRTTALTLALEPSTANRALWPHDARLEVIISIGERLHIALTTTNRGRGPLPLSQAIHTYFRVGDIAAVTVDGLDGCRYRDALSGETLRQSGALRIDSEVDRIYETAPSPLVLVDTALRWRITISAGGSASTVVWNPWVAKAERLGDLGPDGYRHMLCLETANAGADLRLLAPGTSHTLSAEFAVATL